MDFVPFEIIEVIAMCLERYLQTEVADNRPVQNTVCLNEKLKTKGQAAFSHTGFGMQNTVERLSFLYPDKHYFKIFRGLIMGCCVQIFIPMDPL